MTDSLITLIRDLSNQQHTQTSLTNAVLNSLSFLQLVQTLLANAMGFHKSALVARGADTQLDPSCVSTTN